MAGASGLVSVLEHGYIPPPLDHSDTEKLLHLTFFDMFWLNWPPLSRVYFYDLPCSKAEFTQTIVPQLKKSLAMTLKHYYYFSGNLIVPTSLSSHIAPAIRYLKGDSVYVVIAEFKGDASKGFKHVCGNHVRLIYDLLRLVPELPPGYTHGIENDRHVASPVLSVQVTLFPGQGFSVGFRNSHVIADGKSMSDFIRTWACINAKQLRGEDDYDKINTLPFYDRSVIKDPKGIASIFLRESLPVANSHVSSPRAHHCRDLVQATLLINRVQIQGLKHLVTDQYPQVSSFVVTCAYVWTCMAKARMALQQFTYDKEEVKEHFVFMMDTRERLDPPVPSNYFGNAVVNCRCSLNTSLLVVEQEGLKNAVKEIRRVLDEKLNNEEGVVKGFEKVFDVIKASIMQHKFGVSGSPKFDYYSTDFGWGKPIKYEAVSEKFGLVGSRDSDGGLEIGVCFPKPEMEVFTAIFTQGLIS